AALRFLASAALAIGLFPLVARADFSTPVQTQSVPLTLTDWGPDSTTHPVAPLQFQKFDPALGTLQSVSVTLDYQFDSTVSLTFRNPSTLTEGVAGVMVLARSDATGTSIFDPAAANFPQFTNIVQQTVASGFPQTISSTKTFTGAIQTKLTGSSDLSMFTGP